MTYDEVKTSIDNLIKSPETAETEALTLLEGLKSDYDTMDSLTAKVTEQDNKIKTLQDTNQRLYLSITKGTPEEEKEDEPGIDWDALLKEEKED